MMSVYLIQQKILFGTQKYKIGTCTKNKLTNIKLIHKECIVVCLSSVPNPKQTEKTLLDVFKNKYIEVSEQGYFEGNVFEMLCDYMKIVLMNTYKYQS